MQAPAAEPASEKEIVSLDKLKPVPKPDENELKEKIEDVNGKISALQTRLTSIKDVLDSREQSRGDSHEVAVAKKRLNDSKSETRRLSQEKRNIYDQISAADDLKKQQQDLTQRLKSQLTLFSVEEIERKIKVLEHQQQTTSLSVKEEKKILEEIKKLASNKPMIQQYNEAKESLEGVREHHSTLYAQLKAKAAELNVVKEEEEKLREEVEAAKAKDDAKRADIPSLFKERDEVRKKMSEFRDQLKKLRDDFNDKRREWQTYQRAVRDAKQKEYKERQAARQAEYELQKKLYEEEEAKRDPWEEEKVICEQLILFVEKLLPKKEEVKEVAKEAEIPEGAKVVKKASLDDDDIYGGLVKKKSKRKGGGGGGNAAAAAPAAPKAIKLKHSPEDFALWDKLGFKAPMSSEECPNLHVELLAKREWLKTAPPKPKKKPKEEKVAEEAAAKKEAASEGGDIDYAAELKTHLTGALNTVLASQPSDPFRAIQQILFQASLVNGPPETAAAPAKTPELTKYITKYNLEVLIDDCLFKMKKRLVVGPKDGFKFLLSDAGDFYTEWSKKLKAAGGDLGLGMTAEELAAKDAADMKAKREKEAKAEAERDAADALNAQKTAEMEASGKKVSGGLHKFDAAEVDVHGGNATADDFMDAFGFGDGDLGGDDEPEAEADVAASGAGAGMLQIQAISDSSVQVSLTLA